MSRSHHQSWLKKDTKTEYQTKNHRLMMKAGLIFQTSSGIYSWLPHGLKALQKLMKLCQKHFKKSDCSEVVMPHILSTHLIKESGRLHLFGQDILSMKDRKGHEMYFGPTHEEPIVNLMKSYVRTYKQLPQTLYQIQGKFRDELRPRGGVLRARELLMLDAYSFHATYSCLQNTYRVIKDTFKAILDDLLLPYVIVEADCGAIGGEFSEELQIISPIGEDVIFQSSNHGYAANIEKATYDVQRLPAFASQSLTSHYFTNGTDYLQVMMGNPYTPHILKINQVTGQSYIPIEDVKVDRFKLTTLYDYSVKGLLDEVNQFVDVRNVIDGDYAIDGGILSSAQSIEVGHIFELGDYYSRRMKLEVTNQENQQVPVLMGCYGLGLSRLLGVCIEIHSTEDEIRWPQSINPYDLALIPLGKNNHEKAQMLYDLLHIHGDKEVFISVGGNDSSKIKNARILGCPYLLLIKDDSYVLQALAEKQEQVIPSEQFEILIQLLQKTL